MRPKFLSFLIAIVLLLPVATCSQDSRVIVHTSKGEFAFEVEIAETPQERSKGLMFRQELAADAGMLFDFQTEQPVSFWMRNTLIPLDMIFIAGDGTVKKVHAKARPLDPTSIPSGTPVRFVLEIIGGRAAEIGLAAGDRIDHPRIDAGN